LSRPTLQRFWNLLGDVVSSPSPSRRLDASGQRTRGSPPSANGASSLHLRWDLDASVGLREVSVTLEVIEAPRVDRLYFWALQADFCEGPARGPGAGSEPARSLGRSTGGAHLGLQWHPQHPGATAVNWGGYDASGRELGGSASSLPSALANVNTRDLVWHAATPYRLRIARVDGPGTGSSPDDGAGTAGSVVRWRGSVTGPDGRTVDIRDLHTSGDRIGGVVMWSEVFARCDDPTVAVRWSDPEAVTVDGASVAPRRLSVNYQSVADGGCTNTDSRVDGIGVVQSTNVPRTTRQGDMLATPLQGGPSPEA